MADVVFQLVCDDVVDLVEGLENGMGATLFGRFMLVRGRISIVEESVAP